MLSKRSSHVAPMPLYISKQLAVSGNRYCPHHNPNGAILMSICENKLCGDMILDRINETTHFDSNILNYTDPTGLPEFKIILSRFLERMIFKHCDVNPDNIVVSAGCTALIYQMSVCLFDPGDSVLIPTPWYAAFEMDFAAIGNVSVVRVQTEAPTFALTIEKMNKSYEEAVESGHPPKAFVLTNPSNPLGIVHTVDEILSVVSWCRQRHMHCIMDEVYALSILNDPSTNESIRIDTSGDTNFESLVESSLVSDGVFVSSSTALGNVLDEDVHILWGCSKDLAASGLRVGVLYTHNKALVKAMSSLIGFQVSNITQEIFARIFADDKFVHKYFRECRRRLAASRAVVVDTLSELEIEVVPGQCNLFIFANFRPLLGSDGTFAAERALFDQLVDDCGLCFTPGESCGCSAPGYFRICYAWEPYTTVCEAMRRLKVFHSSKKAAAV